MSIEHRDVGAPQALLATATVDAPEAGRPPGPYTRPSPNNSGAHPAATRRAP